MMLTFSLQLHKFVRRVPGLATSLTETFHFSDGITDFYTREFLVNNTPSDIR